jgi:hypothetical protein
MGLTCFDFLIGNQVGTGLGVKAEMATCDCGLPSGNLKWPMSAPEVPYGIANLC